MAHILHKGLNEEDQTKYDYRIVNRFWTDGIRKKA
jgi:hypothetical protein